jgi:hypothetical protein
MNPTVSMVSIGLDDVVAGLKAALQNVPFRQLVNTWAGQPFRYDRATRKVSWVISGDGPTVSDATWAAAIVQSPATATVQSVPLRTALGLD